VSPDQGFENHATLTTGTKFTSGSFPGEDGRSLFPITRQHEKWCSEEPGERKIFDGYEMVISFDQVNFERAEGPPRSGIAVMNDRPGGGDGSPSVPSGPESEIGIFGIGEKILVKEPDLIDHPSPVQGGGGTRVEDIDDRTEPEAPRDIPSRQILPPRVSITSGWPYTQVRLATMPASGC